MMLVVVVVMMFVRSSFLVAYLGMYVFPIIHQQIEMSKLKTISVVIHNLVLILRDGLVWLANDRASSTRCVLAPEAFGKGGSVLLAKLAPFGEGAPGIVIRKRNPLRLGRTVRSGTRLRKILLVILLGKIPKSSIFVVVSRRGNFSSDFSLCSSLFLQRLFISLFRSFDQLFLFLVEIVKAFVIVEWSSCSKNEVVVRKSKEIIIP